MDVKGWAWVLQHGDESDYWAEQVEIDRWLESGMTAEEWLGRGAPAEAEAAPKPATATGQTPPVPKLAFSREMAADALSISVDHFDRHVKPHLRVIQSGARMMVPVTELQRWVDESAARALKD